MLPARRVGMPRRPAGEELEEDAGVAVLVTELVRADRFACHTLTVTA